VTTVFDLLGAVMPRRLRYCCSRRRLWAVAGVPVPLGVSEANR